MKPAVATLMMLTFLVPGMKLADEQKKNQDDPSKRKDAILKLFTDEFVPITPGKKPFPESFIMGSEKDGPDSERPAHKVTFKYSFAMAKHEVTQELYHVVMGKNQAEFQGPRNGMDKVTWPEANEFCDKATKLLRDAKLIGANERIRLPSEAEWEYCCRAGTKTKWSFGDELKEIGKYAWWKENSKGEDPPVGKKLPNAWGLYDMHGYVWEWCADLWHPDYKGAPADGSPWTKGDGKERVLRGGAYNTAAEDMRCAARHHADPETRSGTIGFRCVLAKE